MIALLLGLGSAMLVAACGGGESVEPKLSAENAKVLQAEIEVIRQNAEDQNCTVAVSHAQTLVDQVQQLSGSIDPDLLEALEEGAKNLRDLLEDPSNCEEQETTTETTEETTEATTETTEETTEQTTETTETTTPTTTPTTPPPGDGSGGTGL